METPQQYYTGNGAMTGGCADLRIPGRSVGELCGIIQGVLLHADIAPWLYDLKFAPDRYNDKHIRPIPAMVARIRGIADRPLAAAREPRDRMACVCRHFSLMLCAMMREQGVPARTRVGFGAYFHPGKFEDHWVCEYWNAAESRWILVDAQLDAIQRRALRIDFDPLDVPRDRFIIAGDAWRMCRSGRANPDAFGLSYVPHLHGMWFIAGNILRDLASLNRMEMLPWDVWGMMAMDDAGLTADKRELLDRIAALTMAGDEAFPELRRLYEEDERLRVPPAVFNAERNATEQVGA